MGFEPAGLHVRLRQIQAESEHLKERLAKWMEDAHEAYKSPDPPWPNANMVADVQMAADCHRACAMHLEKALSR